MIPEGKLPPSHTRDVTREPVTEHERAVHDTVVDAVVDGGRERLFILTADGHTRGSVAGLHGLDILDQSSTRVAGPNPIAGNRGIARTSMSAYP